jgi:magnesium transporter
MITIYKSGGSGLEIIDRPENGCWYNVVAPTKEEVAQLQQELSAPQDFVTYPLDVDERPRIEREDSATLILLGVPYFQGEGADVPYITVPLGIVLTSTAIATISRAETDVIRELISGRVRGLSTDRRSQFILRLLLTTANRYLVNLREIERATDRLEDQLQRSQRNKEVLELLKFQKSLVYFRTALRSNELVLEHLHKEGRWISQRPEDQDLLEDVLTEVQQAIDMANISSNILAQTTGTFASIISNNLNVVMKFLTSATIILSLPTMIASFYGMNVSLPLERSPYGFAIVLSVSLAISLIVVFAFWRRDWL